MQIHRLIYQIRSAERTFQLLTQVAGRAVVLTRKEVIIQTYNPSHYAILSVCATTGLWFLCLSEMGIRRQLAYPAIFMPVGISPLSTRMSLLRPRKS